MINYPEIKNYITCAYINIIKEFLNIFYIAKPAQNDIFISSCQNYILTTLSRKNNHEVYAMLPGLKNKRFFIYDDVLGLQI